MTLRVRARPGHAPFLPGRRLRPGPRPRLAARYWPRPLASLKLGRGPGHAHWGSPFKASGISGLLGRVLVNGCPLTSRKMTASCGPRRAPRRPPFSSWSHFLGNLLVTLALWLPASTDACDKIPTYASMKAKGNPVPPVSAGFAVEYECRLGYRIIVPLVRPTTTVCQPDGTWAPPLREACTRKSCPQLAEPINGRLEGTFQFGAQANYSCNVGYHLVGTRVLRCELAGDGNNVAWSSNPPQCEKILCQPPQQIENGTFSNSHKNTFEYNEVVTYSCKPSGGPDEYSLVGKSKLICSGPNKWSSDPPKCKVVRCDYPSLPDGELVSGFRKKYYYKAEVEFKCNQGYSLEGSGKIVCEANSTWVPEIPRCVKGVKSPGRPTPDETLVILLIYAFIGLFLYVP